MAMKKRTTTSPTMAPRRRMRRRSARCHGFDSGRTARVAVVAVIAVMPPALPSRPKARVDEEIGDVGKEVEDDVGGRGEKHHTLHHRVVAVEDGIDDELAEARDGEDLLGE